MLVLSLGVSLAKSARAADTIELFDPGLSDFELYTGVDGVGERAAGRKHFAAWVLGAGLGDHLSAVVEGELLADGEFLNGDANWAAGCFATLLDRVHFDWDVGLGASLAEGSLSNFAFTELNFDAEPDQALAGGYLLFGAELYGRETLNGGGQLGLLGSGSLGAYVTPSSDHQLLLELDAVLIPRPSASERRIELGGVRIGYNVMVTDSIELINELSLDLPQGDESWLVGGSTGILVTLGQ